MGKEEGGVNGKRRKEEKVGQFTCKELRLLIMELRLIAGQCHVTQQTNVA